jgi:hypothetical protein
MPRAVSGSKTERFELKTLPGTEDEEAGFVELRRMTYGQLMDRRNLASGMKLTGQGKKQMEATIDLTNRKVTEYEFRVCIVDHNLEDENGNKLDIRKPSELQKIDSQIGDEISRLIDKMNQFEDDDDELGNFGTE